jgi:hypothetical protein
MNLRDAFPRPTPEQTEAALHKMLSGALPEARTWYREVWKVAAVIAGLSAAYAAGFASGRHTGEGPKSERAPIVKAGEMTIRPPVLIAGPRS